MSDFLHHYEAELDYLQRALVTFEKAHPIQARALGISAGQNTDPNLKRVSDSVAMLLAKMQKRLDDTRSEISLDILKELFPNILLGAPSYASVFVDPKTVEQKTSLKRGTAVIYPEKGAEHCRYSVAKNTTLHPVSITQLSVETAPFPFTAPAQAQGCDLVIRMQLNAVDGETNLDEIIIDGFELFINASGPKRQVLGNLLSGHIEHISVTHSPTDIACDNCVGSIRPSALTASSLFLPHQPQQSVGLERLNDFLAFPAKGDFFEIDIKLPAAPSAEIHIFTRTKQQNILFDLETTDILTNVIPCINLFQSETEPLRYDYSRDRTVVTPYIKCTAPIHSLQIANIHRLTAEGEVELSSILTPEHNSGGHIRWQERYLIGEHDPARREVSFSMPGANPEPIDFVGTVLCSNGPEGSKARPKSNVVIDDGNLTSANAVFLKEPIQDIAPNYDVGRQWDLIALINGNFGAILETANPTDSLRQTLNLCSPRGFTDFSESIVSLTCDVAVAPIKIGAHVMLASGHQIEIVIDHNKLPLSEYVFGHVLNDFFKSLVSYDRFIELILRRRGETTAFVTFERQHGSQVAL